MKRLCATLRDGIQRADNVGRHCGLMCPVPEQYHSPVGLIPKVLTRAKCYANVHFDCLMIVSFFAIYKHVK